MGHVTENPPGHWHRPSHQRGVNFAPRLIAWWTYNGTVAAIHGNVLLLGPCHQGAWSHALMCSHCLHGPKGSISKAIMTKPYHQRGAGKGTLLVSWEPHSKERASNQPAHIHFAWKDDCLAGMSGAVCDDSHELAAIFRITVVSGMTCVTMVTWKHGIQREAKSVFWWGSSPLCFDIIILKAVHQGCVHVCPVHQYEKIFEKQRRIQPGQAT